MLSDLNRVDFGNVQVCGCQVSVNIAITVLQWLGGRACDCVCVLVCMCRSKHPGFASASRALCRVWSKTSSSLSRKRCVHGVWRVFSAQGGEWKGGEVTLLHSACSALHRPHLRTGPSGWTVWCPRLSNHMKANQPSPKLLASSFSSGPFIGNCPTVQCGRM